VNASVFHFSRNPQDKSEENEQDLPLLPLVDALHDNPTSLIEPDGMRDELSLKLRTCTLEDESL